jgi:4-hydroxybenzoate polyprenyltransferase
MILTVFVLGTLLTRSAGCIINDFADRNFDPHVERTRERPLAARRVSPYEAIGLFIFLMLLAFILVLQLDMKTVLLSLVAGGLLGTYPLFKRFFPAPQLYLGLAFGWAVPMAFMATQGKIPVVGWLVFAATVIWACIYDTFYAMVDRDDDRRIGIRSTALLFGRYDLIIIIGLQALMILLLTVVGVLAGLGWVYLVGVACAAALFVSQVWSARSRGREVCFRAFLDNHYVGLVLFLGIALATAQH